MRAVRPRLRHGAFLALLSLWVMTLAPTLARWHAAMDPLAWVPVCTSQGPMQGQTAADGSALPNPAEHLRGGDSLFLTPQAAMPALAAAEPTLVLSALAAAAPHAAPVCNGHAAPPWPGAQARAPPAA